MADVRSRLAQRGPLGLAAIAVPLLALAVLAVVLVSGMLSDDDVDGRAGDDGVASEQSTADGDDVAADTPRQPGTDADEDAGSSAVAPGQISDPVVPPEELPLSASFSGGSGLHDGDTITLVIAADDGSQIYAAEARLCAGDAVITTDSDIRPSRTGQCVAEPLSPVSDATVFVENPPPYEELTLSFRVGVGSESYTTQTGDDVTIICDRDHPCSLAVKFQVPYGYGFRTYPLEFA